MKKYLLLGLLLCFGFAGLSAQAEITPSADETPIRAFNLRKLTNHLSLDYNQVVILKAYYADTNTAMYDQLRPVTDEAQRDAITYNFTVMRDEKIRDVLTEEQIVLYEELQNPVITEPNLPTLPGGGGQ